MTVLITGGMGFIGLHTARAFVDAGEDVVITWFQTWREPSFIADEYNGRVLIEKADVSQGAVIQELAQKHRVEHICHLAVPGLGALTPYEDYQTNMQGLIGVLEAARNAEVERLTIASSIACYHSLPEGPYRETDRLPIQSANPTETFKKAWEILSEYYAGRTGLGIVNMRIGGIWGPLYHTMMNIPSRLAHAAAHGAEPDFSAGRGGVPCADDTLDICYVKDTAKGIAALQLAERLEHRVYNLSGGEAVTVQRLVDAANAAKPGANIAVQPGRGPRFKERNYMDMTRMNTELGFETDWTVERAMADYVAWLDAGNER